MGESDTSQGEAASEETSSMLRVAAKNASKSNLRYALLSPRFSESDWVPLQLRRLFLYSTMLNRKTAADTASQHLTDLIPIEGAPVLEEHFYADGIWQITLSYKPAASPGAASGNGTAPRRELKSFAIDSRSGEVLSMKIRSLKD